MHSDLRFAVLAALHRVGKKEGVDVLWGLQLLVHLVKKGHLDPGPGELSIPFSTRLIGPCGPSAGASLLVSPAIISRVCSTPPPDTVFPCDTRKAVRPPRAASAKKIESTGCPTSRVPPVFSSRAPCDNPVTHKERPHEDCRRPPVGRLPWNRCRDPGPPIPSQRTVPVSLLR